MPEIRPYTEDRFDPLVTFIARLNSAGEHHIGYFGLHPADIAATLRELIPPLHETFFVALDGDQIVGVLGAEVDRELGRAWLFGPLIEHPAWDDLADRLYAALIPRLPEGAPQHEIFCDARNVRLQAFAERHGFPRIMDSAILNFPRERLDSVPGVTLPLLTPPYIEQFAALHERVFPNTYYSARQIVERCSEHEQVFIAAQDGALLGYVFGRVEPDAGEGYIDFLGVAENARRQGIGRQLVAAILHWMFGFAAVQRVDLTVTASNEAALRLYDGLGFTCERVMRAYRTGAAAHDP